MRSGFLRDREEEYGGFTVSQSLLNEVWFPTLNVSRTASLHLSVAIPSKWGLVSYVKVGEPVFTADGRNPF